MHKSSLFDEVFLCLNPKTVLEGKTWSHTHDILNKLKCQNSPDSAQHLTDQPLIQVLGPNGKPFLWEIIRYFMFSSSFIQMFDRQSQMKRIVKKQDHISHDKEKKVTRNRSTNVKYENFKTTIINNDILKNKYNR